MRKNTPNWSTTGPLAVALAYDGLCTFEFAIAAEIFGLPRPEMGADWYRFAASGIEPGPLRAQGGLRVEVDGGLDLLEQASLIIVPGWKGAAVPVPRKLVDVLTIAHAAGARIASICSGAFVIAATGLLNGKRAATHWRHAEALARAYPAINVDASVLYIDNDRVLTSAGSAAGIDLMLHIVRKDFGADAANSVARRLVVQPHRSGGQAQFVERPVATNPASRLGPLLDRIRAEPSRDWTIDTMAREAAMSQRTFLRRFDEATSTSPREWLIGIRIDAARRILETTAASIEDVARLSGFGSVAALRYHLKSETGLTPRTYRDAFRHVTAITA
ncbi:MAG: transcriptional regulator FtrA [Acetobacteraceae bacterium]|nr:transcriptional regulator FtrA [Acetobacteraceae bacterium]